jgi:hypothetical protein
MIKILKPFGPAKIKKSFIGYLWPRALYVRRAAFIKTLSVSSRVYPFSLHFTPSEMIMLSGDIPAGILFLSDSRMGLQVNSLLVIFTPESVLFLHLF